MRLLLVPPQAAIHPQPAPLLQLLLLLLPLKHIEPYHALDRSHGPNLLLGSHTAAGRLGRRGGPWGKPRRPPVTSLTQRMLQGQPPDIPLSIRGTRR